MQLAAQKQDLMHWYTCGYKGKSAFSSQNHFALADQHRLT